MMTIEEFCDRHGACRSGRAWARKRCRDLPHAWDTARPDRLLWMATRTGVLDDRTLRHFAVWCARQVQHLMTDQRSLAALDVAERYAEGQATAKQLLSARHAAEAVWVAGAATGDAEWAASSAAQAAAQAAELAASVDAAWAASSAAQAAAQAAWASAGDAAWEAARAAQASWLRANAKPNWEAKP